MTGVASWIVLLLLGYRSEANCTNRDIDWRQIVLQLIWPGLLVEFGPRKQWKGDNKTGYKNRWQVMRWAGDNHFHKTSMYFTCKDLNRKKISRSSDVVLFTSLWNCSVCKIFPGKLTCSLMEISPSPRFYFWHCSEPSGCGVWITLL